MYSVRRVVVRRARKFNSIYRAYNYFIFLRQRAFWGGGERRNERNKYRAGESEEKKSWKTIYGILCMYNMTKRGFEIREFY